MRVRALGRVPALDGVRAVAVALVIASHAWAQPGGAGLGVDVFFTLSGFLITCLLLSERAVTGSISLRRFYARRALRILPAFWTLTAVLALFALTAHLAEAGREGMPHWGAGVATSLGYLANVSIAFGWAARVPADLRHTWSLALEEQFYLVWPIVLVALLAARLTLRKTAFGLLTVIGASVIDQQILWHAGVARARIWYGPDTHLEPIAVGCVAAVAYTHRLVPDELVRRLVPVAASVCLVAVAVPPYDHRYLYDGPFAVFPFACATILWAASCGMRAVAAPLENRVLRYLGRISYGIYLWHFPLDGHFGPWIGIPATVAVASLSYYVVERPFLRLKERVARRRPSEAVAAVSA